MEWFNALQKRTDEAIQWLLQHALPDWVVGTWPAGATVVNGGIVWRAQKETAAEPAADAGDWLALFPLANLEKRYLHADKNLSDLKDAASARKNLELGELATKDNLTAADVDAYSKEEADAKYIPETSIGVHNGQVMAVNSRYPSENNNTNAFMSNNTPTLAAAESTHKPSLEVSNNGNKSAAAVLMLHREGDFATYFGLDTDNSLAIGGYSFDKVRHRIFHEGFTGNLSTQADAQSRADTAYNNAVNQINAAFGSATAGYWHVDHNGQIFQSGRVTVQGSLHVTFPAAFPNAATCIVLTAGTTDNVSVTYNNDNAAGFDVYVRGGSGTDSVSWFAMGY
ncbi:gp53-like domain-containing protein [Pantoea agglomerans]|uniref:gp53-like domain-containing protein n=1 Tax=Enterobacter agglomerans TaxID=549 RepID=UPI0024136CE9|nr:hypothetical protein [Pantoea agglomerans]